MDSYAFKAIFDARFKPKYNGLTWGPFSAEGTYGWTFAASQTFSAFLVKDRCNDTISGGGCPIDLKICPGFIGGVKLKAWSAEGTGEVIGQGCLTLKVCFVSSIEDQAIKLRWQFCGSAEAVVRGTVKTPYIGEWRIQKTFSASGCTEWQDLASLD